MAGVTRKGAGADIRDRRTFSQQSDGLWNFVVWGCRFAVWSEGSIILTTILPNPFGLSLFRWNFGLEICKRKTNSRDGFERSAHRRRLPCLFRAVWSRRVGRRVRACEVAIGHHRIQFAVLSSSNRGNRGWQRIAISGLRTCLWQVDWSRTAPSRPTVR